MRVLHVIPSLAKADGGPSHAVQVMERALHGRGIDVEIATTESAADGERAEGPENSVRRYFRRNTRFYKVSMPLGWWLWRRAGDYDLLHVHALFSFSSLAAALAARWHRIPYVLRPLGTLANYGMSRRRPWLKRLSFGLLESRMLRNAAAVHFTSSQEWEEASSLGVAVRGVVIPLALDPALPGDAQRLLKSDPRLRDKTCVLFLSRLDPKKNVEGLLHAIAACAPDVPDAHWLIAGDGEPEYCSSLHQLAARLRINERISWLGRIEGADKAAAFAAASLFVLPSWSENFGIAAAEALQAGLPVVLGSGVALSGVAAEAGAGTITDGTPENICTAMKAYLVDRERRQGAASEAARLASREFSPQALGERLEQLYVTISSERSDA